MCEKQITALEPQKRSKDRLNVYLDGAFAFGLATAAALDLRVGMRLTPEQVEALKRSDEVERARSRALDYLSYRPRSESELQRYLLKRDFSQPAVDDVLQRLRRVGLVDDEAFAQYWIENRARFRPKGRFVLRHELRQKGVADAVIERALEGYDEATAARDVALAQARRLTHLPAKDFRRRLTQRMARRGFSYETIRETLEALPLSDFISNESEEDWI